MILLRDANYLPSPRLRVKRRFLNWLLSLIMRRCLSVLTPRLCIFPQREDPYHLFVWRDGSYRMAAMGGKCHVAMGWKLSASTAKRAAGPQFINIRQLSLRRMLLNAAWQVLNGDAPEIEVNAQ